MWRDRKTLRREMGENTQDGTPGSWFKITVSVLARSALDRISWNLIKRKTTLNILMSIIWRRSFQWRFHWRV